MPYKDREKKKIAEHESYLKRKDTGYFRKIRAEYRRREREKHQLYFEMIVAHYGGKCACCGETNHKFLTVDHINGGGHKHRKQISNKIYRWLVLNNFPDGYQILCFNCNCGKNRNHGVCPHQESRLTALALAQKR